MKTVRILLLLLAVVVSVSVSASTAAAGANAVTSKDGIDVWAVGDVGVIYRSFDGGASYLQQTLGNKTLRGVAHRALTVIVVGDSGKVWRSTDNGGGFAIDVMSGTPDLRAVAMPADQVAYLAGETGTIRKSTDGGATWSPQTSGTSDDLYALAFEDEDDGWAVGENGTVLHTTNGGTTWNPVSAGTSNDLFGVAVNGSNVWVVGAHGTARKSTNGGSNWSAVNLRLDAHANVRGVSLAGADSVVLVGGGGFIRISDDGGTTWNFPEHGLHAPASALHVGSGRMFVANESNSIVLRSTDGGASWQFPSGTGLSQSWVSKLNPGATERGNTFAINGQNPNTVYVMLGGQVYVSRDLGETWATQGNAVAGVTKSNSFLVSPKDSTLFVAAVGGSGDKIVRSTNGGNSWSTEFTKDFGEFGLPIEMDPDRPDTLYFGADDDVLFRSTNFGDTWSSYSSTVFRSPCDIVVVPESDSLVVLVGDGVTNVDLGKMWRATNGSTAFQNVYTGGSNSSEIPTVSNSRLRNNVVFLTSWSAPKAHVSTDFGLTWTPVAPIIGKSSTWGTEIARDDPNVVLIGRFSGGQTFLSVDGGASFDSLSHSGSNYAYLARDRAFMLHMTSTGVYKLNNSYSYTPGGSQSLTLNDPNGGESWPAGQIRTINWNATNVGLALIEYRLSSSDPWVEIAQVEGYLGTYDWTVPHTPTTQAEVRVSDAWDGSPSDVTSGVFTIEAPAIATTPESLDFGNVPNGSPSTLVVTIDNPGTATLSITSTGTATQEFTPGRNAFSISSGGNDTLGVTFIPPSSGSYVDTLEIQSDVPGAPVRIPLEGTGIEPPMLSLASPDGGELWPYGSAQLIQWTHVSLDSVVLEYEKAPGAGWVEIASAFPADSNQATWIIPDAESNVVSVRIREKGGALADSSAGVFSITVPRFAMTPQGKVHMGLVTTGMSFDQTLWVSNSGSTTLVVPSISIDDPDFSLNTSSLLIQGSNNDSLKVTFAPTVPGPDTALVIFTHNGPTSPDSILVTAEGTNTVSVPGDPPLAFALNQNQPNPFLGTTRIRYALPVRADVTLEVFDLQGKRVGTLVRGIQEPGQYSVPFGASARTFDGAPLQNIQSGVYFYRLRAGVFMATRKMLLLR